MTPKEQAKEILTKYMFYKVNSPIKDIRVDVSKRNAIIAVELVLEYEDMPVGNKEYWLEVKTEIEKL